MERSIILVTGASRGIGKATATLLSQKGFRVFGTSRKVEPGASSGFTMLPLDVTSPASVDQCVSTLLDRAGRIDALVNNAGVGIIGAIEETPMEDAEVLYETNFFGAARMVNAVLPSMRQRKSGLIINIGSMVAALPIPFHGYLTSSKAAVASYSDALRLELKHLGIAVTVVEPGMVATHQGEGFEQLKVKNQIGDYSSNEWRAISAVGEGQSGGGSPDEVAETILRVVRTERPARYYFVGREKWYVRATRLLPPSAVEAFMIRHFRLK